ncbi:MAG: thiamine diphosphokinase [Clostridiales bacterium]|jgi:thiamine pyrophosphokinase|nr:thiamine diphosphokinase [Clostridiales bacterium]
MKVLIIANGDIGDSRKVKDVLPAADYVICADGGLRHAKELGLVPDLILGDFDSLAHGVLEEYRTAGVPIRKYPQDKDKTDTQIAVDIAIDMGATHVYLLGAFGSRWDHSYANMMMLYRLAKRNIEAWILDAHNIVMVSNGVVRIKGQAGQFISLLPLGEDVHIISTQGLKYPIIDKWLPLDFPYGISNVFVQPYAEIQIGEGWLIIVKASD